MKYICKGAEPTVLTQWKAVNPQATYKDLSDRQFPDSVPTKAALKQALITEQGGLCCYCECRIQPHNSHIEHFKPKGDPLYSAFQLDYSNLLASCGIRPCLSSDEHCGHKKGCYYTTDLISPLEVDCSSHFTYKLDGTIGHTGNRGDITIRKLHLDSSLLNRQRKSLIDYFLTFDDEELQEEIAAHLDNTCSIFGEFYTMIDFLHSNGNL